MAVKVNQKSRTFPVSQGNVDDKNMFDLSHDVKTTFTMGKLVPFLVEEVLPSDQWFIRGEFMLRFAPLYLPIMHRVNLSADYFFVPNRILWPRTQILDAGAEQLDGWEIFITNQAGQYGVPSQTHPYVTILPQDNKLYTNPVAYELPAYMGFPTQLPDSTYGALASWNVNAFPLSAYYMIWDFYYRNDQIQAIVWGQLSTGDNTDVFPNFGTPQYLSCQFRNWNRDYFTSATPLPQLGQDVQIPLVDTDFISPGGQAYGGPFRWRLAAAVGAGSGDLTMDPGAPDPGRSEEIDGDPVYLDIQETAGSIAQLRYALMYQEFLERSLRGGDKYNDQVDIFWREDPYRGVVQQPEFIGSKKGKVVISEVLSTTETATLKVGSYAGQAISLESTNATLEYHAKEWGFILGIISVYPDSSYMQGIEKMWTRTQQTDYAWPQFALVGDQPILNKEINADLANIPADPDYNDGVFGYIPRYSEYRYRNDKYTGLMRSVYISFHLGRILDVVTPSNTVLDSDFLECRPDISRVFQVTEIGETGIYEDEIFAHIYNDVKVLRRLPKFGIPAV